MKTKLQEIKGRADRATAGPWERTKFNNIIVNKEEIVSAEYAADIKFIAHARQDVPWLLDMIQQLQGRERVLRDALELLTGMCESVGNFSNGVTHQGMDQGDIMAGQVIDRARELLDKVKQI